MSPLEELMNRRWILKSQDFELYYRIKDSIKEIRKIVQDKFGYIVLVNPYLIKLEKIPGKSEIWMGIQDFQSIKEYQMFCFLLMFLEDKEREEQFVLSSLTEYIQMQFEEGEIEWTNLITRRQLIRVIKYCVSQGLMKQTDGDEDRFAQNIESEVLYENIGISRYFLRNFMKDIIDYKTPIEFEQSEWIDMEEDRGIVRRQRVYRRLLLSPGVYRANDQDDDFQYIRHYRRQVQNDFDDYFHCDIHIHKSSAYINLNEDCQMGKIFPFNNTISDLILLVCSEIYHRVSTRQFELNSQEHILISKDSYLRICNNVIAKKMDMLPKKYQEFGEAKITLDILETMKKYGFIMDIEEVDMLIIYPAVAKLNGNYSMKEEG